MRKALTGSAAALAACGLLLAAGVLQANDWPQFLGPARTGISAEAGWKTDWPAGGPRKVWEFQVGTGYSCVSVADGRAFTVGNAKDTDTVYCLDAAKGKVLWSKSYPCKGGSFPGPRCSPTVDGDVVYTLSIGGDINCWAVKDGKNLWSKKASALGGKAGGWGFACSPLVLGDKLIVDIGLTAALDKKTGAVAWKTAGYTPGYSSPIAFKAGGKELLAIFTGDGLKVFAAGDGAPVASYPWKTSYDVNAAVPVISEAGIYITSGYGRGGTLVKLEGETLTKVWENKDLASHFATPVLLGGNLYGVSGNVGQGPIRCLELATGKTLWSHEGNGSPILVGGKLLVLGSGGRLAVVDPSPESYKEVASMDLGKGTWWNAPVLANGLIYCRSHEGKLVCLDVKP